MRPFRILGLALVLALASIALAVEPAIGQAPAPTPAAAPTSLKLNGADATRVKGQLALSATLTAGDGSPMGDQSVDFYQHVELFGSRLSYIGSATSDSTGTAVLAYQPAETGRQTITAQFAGAEGRAAAEANGTIDVPTVVAPFEPEPLPLAPVSHWMPFILAGLVFATWVVLLGVFLGTSLGIRAAVPSMQTSRQPLAPAPAPRSRGVGGDA